MGIRKVKKNWRERKQKRKVIGSFYSFDRIHKRWWAGGSEGGLEKVWKRERLSGQWFLLISSRCIWLLLWRHSYDIYERRVNRVLWKEALAAQRPVVGSMLPHAGQGRLLGDPFSVGAHFGLNVKDWYIAKQRLLLLKETTNHSYFWFLWKDYTSMATQPHRCCLGAAFHWTHKAEVCCLGCNINGLLL